MTWPGASCGIAPAPKRRVKPTRPGSRVAPRKSVARADSPTIRVPARTTGHATRAIAHRPIRTDAAMPRLTTLGTDIAVQSSVVYEYENGYRRRTGSGADSGGIRGGRRSAVCGDNGPRPASRRARAASAPVPAIEARGTSAAAGTVSSVPTITCECRLSPSTRGRA